MLGFNKSHLSSGLLQSSLHNQDNFYEIFTEDLLAARQEVIIESPFITYKRLTYLMPVLRRLVESHVAVIINTKHPDEQRETNSRAGECIGMLQEAGVKVLFTGGHHRKLAIIDKHILYEGSLNILSQNDSCEIMRRIESNQVANQMIDFIGIKKFIN